MQTYRDRRAPAPDATVTARSAVTLLLVLVLLTGCTSDAETAPAPAPTPAQTDAVLEAREVLGDPMVELAEAVIALADALDEARFSVRRGDDMRRAVRALDGRRKDVAAARRAALAAAAQAPVDQAAEIVASAAAQTRSISPAVAAEVRFLRRISDIDTQLLNAAAAWDEPGSQSEIRERLLAVADDVAALRPVARRLTPVPGSCKRMRRNRLDWIATVRTRTLRLQEQAHSAGGSTFDELRRSFRPLPFAVEPRTADRADRACWLERSQVVATADAMRAAVTELRDSLSR